MRTVALTGSIGSGKTTVLRLLKQQGIATIDSDSIVQKLHKKKKVKEKMRQLFGTTNKKKIATAIFSHPRKRKKLERFLHPLVWREISRQLKLLRRKKKKLAVVDVPLLFEKNWQHRFSSSIVVCATKRQCLRRLKRKGVSRKEALLRMSAQLPASKKVKKAGLVIDNAGSPSKTRAQVKRLAMQLK